MVDTKIVLPMVTVSIVLFLAVIFFNQTVSYQTRSQIIPLIGIAGLAIVLWVIYQPRKKHGYI